MRLTHLLIALVIVGGIAFVGLVITGFLAVGWFNQKNVLDLADKGLQTASGYTAAKTPSEAMEMFREAIQKRKFKYAASYCTKSYADMLIRCHDTAADVGTTIDDLREIAKTKALMTDRASQGLYMLDPFPKNFTIEKPPEQKGDSKAIGKFTWKPLAFKDPVKLAKDSVLPQLDPNLFNNVLAYRGVFLNNIELVKEGEEWKLNIPTNPEWEAAATLFSERAKGFSKELGGFRIYVDNDRYTPEQFENEIIAKLKEMKTR